MDLYFNDQKLSSMNINGMTVAQLKQSIANWLVPQGFINYNIKLSLNNSEISQEVFKTTNYDAFKFENAQGFIKIFSKTHGKIRIAQQARGHGYPQVPGFENIPAWSRGKGEWKLLSPFYLKFAGGEIFENFYQSFKVWEKVDKQKKKDWTWPEEIHVDANGNPNEKWYKWHEALLRHPLPVRRPNGKAIPLYSFFQNQKLGIVDARKQIYIPCLKALYRVNPVYQKLLQMVRDGKNVMLIEPDGPFIEAYPNGLEVDLPMLYSLIEITNYGKEGFPHKYRPYGHGYVLAMTLLEDLN